MREEILFLRAILDSSLSYSFMSTFSNKSIDRFDFSSFFWRSRCRILIDNHLQKFPFSKDNYHLARNMFKIWTSETIVLFIIKMIKWKNSQLGSNQLCLYLLLWRRIGSHCNSHTVNILTSRPPSDEMSECSQVVRESARKSCIKILIPFKTNQENMKCISTRKSFLEWGISVQLWN